MLRVGLSIEIDALSTFIIVLMAIFIAFSSSVLVSVDSSRLLDRIDEQNVAVRIIELLCLSPGSPENWPDNIRAIKSLGLAESNDAYVLSGRKVKAFFKKLTLNQIRSLLKLDDTVHDLKFVLEPLSSCGNTLELGFYHNGEGYISSRLVVVDGLLYVFRVYVWRKQ